MAKENILGITAKKKSDFSDWYTQVLQKSELVDHSPVSGCMVFRPYGYEIWERTQEFLDREFKKRGVKNAYFPLFIPESLLKKEKDHVEGFSPEVAWVTHGGDSKLSERLAVRPTSETIMYYSYSKWIRSYNDLPLKINQWSNIVRWEFKHPTPFIRTREFLWQEGHTVYATKEEADAEVLDIVELYKQAYEEVLAVPVLMGRKSEGEKFAGADYTMSVESLAPNGKAIQGATSHGLGQNFSKAFNITFLDDKGAKKYPWQNSWGYSTRSTGIMVMLHGDDKGLVLPPRVAPIQAVIVPILFSGKPDLNDKIMRNCDKLVSKLKVCRVKLDSSDKTPGWKYNHWEVRGVPVRIEIGPRDLEKKSVMFVRRDTGEKISVPEAKVKEKLVSLLEQIQKDMFVAAKKKLDSSVVKVNSVSGLKKAVDSGKIALVPWSLDGEDEIREKTGAKSLVMHNSKATGKCFFNGKEAKSMFYFGKSY